MSFGFHFGCLLVVWAFQQRLRGPSPYIYYWTPLLTHGGIAMWSTLSLYGIYRCIREQAHTLTAYIPLLPPSQNHSGTPSCHHCIITEECFHSSRRWMNTVAPFSSVHNVRISGPRWTLFSFYYCALSFARTVGRA
jgi:hypothetical protein